MKRICAAIGIAGALVLAAGAAAPQFEEVPAGANKEEYTVPRVTPVGPSRLVTVEPIPAAKPVSVEKLVNIEPLPTKDMEQALLDKEEAEASPEQSSLPPQQEEDEP